jgi:hypothetical protein
MFECLQFSEIIVLASVMDLAELGSGPMNFATLQHFGRAFEDPEYIFADWRIWFC